MEYSMRFRFVAASLAVLALSSVSFGQTTLTQIWKIDADSQTPNWLNSTSNNTRGLSFIPGGNVLVASRDSSNDIVRLDPATGAKVGTLAGNSIFNGGTYLLNKVAVADDGAIFVCNLATATNLLKIYRWASETDSAPTVITSATTTIRLGDEMVVKGAGNSTQILISGSGGNVSKYVTDGTNWTGTVYGSPFPLGSTVCPYMAFDPDGSNFWVRLPNANAKKYALANGADQTFAVGSDPVTPDGAYGPISVAAYGTGKLLALGIGASAATQTGKPVLVFDATTAAPSTKVFQAFNSEFTGGAKANANAAGAIALDVARNKMYNLYTNNSVSAYALPTAGVSDWNLF